MEQKSAKMIQDMVTEFFDKGSELLCVIHTCDDLRLIRASQLALGRCFADVDSDILEPLQQRFPDLRRTVYGDADRDPEFDFDDCQTISHSVRQGH